MRQQVSLAVVTAISAALLWSSAMLPARAQTAQGRADGVQSPAAGIAPAAGTAGRIAKFLNAATVGNSVIFEKGGLIGIGIANPASKLDINAQNALLMRGVQPFLTFRDTNAANARHVIQSVNGGLNLLAEDYLKGTNSSAFVRVDRTGKVGIGTANPLRALQIGPDINAAFTLEPSDGSPRAGFIRFGDKTGWKLHIARQREQSAGPLNTGITGNIAEFWDNGTFRLVGFPAGPTGTGHLCRTLNNTVTMCTSSSSSLRYKTDIAPYRAGLDVVARLRPIEFTRKEGGMRDVGFAAEEVEAIAPLLTFRNENEEIEGVKYELLGTVLVNAIKEQQDQLQRQQALIEQLQSRLARLEGVGGQSPASEQPVRQ